MTTELTLEVQQPPRPSSPPTYDRDYWLNDLIFVTAGKCYGVASNGATVCLGDVGKVQDYFKNGNVHDFTGIQRVVLYRASEILNEEKLKHGESEYQTVSNKFKVVGRGNKRVRLVRSIKHKPAYPGRSKGFQKVPVRTFEQDKPRLFSE
jgi:hypothetical protein